MSKVLPLTQDELVQASAILRAGKKLLSYSTTLQGCIGKHGDNQTCPRCEGAVHFLRRLLSEVEVRGSLIADVEREIARERVPR